MLAYANYKRYLFLFCTDLVNHGQIQGSRDQQVRGPIAIAIGPRLKKIGPDPCWS